MASLLTKQINIIINILFSIFVVEIFKFPIKKAKKSERI